MLFCDLVDSTVLANALDPEDLRDVVRAYHQTCTTVIERRGGHVAQYLGDGILALFGYPMAQENAAVQAAQAGLDLLEEVTALNDRTDSGRGVRLAVRIGIHSGLTIVGPRSESSPEAAAMGHTVHLASRLEGAAEPDQVLVSGDTLRLIEGRFVSEEVGPFDLKGVAEPVAAHRLLTRTVAEGRLESVSARGLTPFVGRETETELLLDRWQGARQGEGAVVLLRGDPGIGKSRLVQAVRERLGQVPCTWLEAHCSLDHSHSAFHPVIRLLERELQFDHDDTPEQRRDKLRRAIGEMGHVADDVPSLLGALLGLPPGPGESRPAMSPEMARRETLEALGGWLRSLAAERPVVLVVEDLHWIDPSTLALLGSIVEEAPTAPILVLLTSRPGFTPPWESGDQAVVTLEPLPPEQNPALIQGIAGGPDLPAEAVEQLIAQADGVPLFLEELTRAVVESGHFEQTGREARQRPLEIPATLQDTLVARLDRLGSSREVAQLAAVVGREFSFKVLEAVSSLDAASLHAALDELRRADLVRELGPSSGGTFTFKHALVREAAYQLTMRSTRRDLHKLIADVLREHFPEVEENQPELLAHHFEASGQTATAIGYFQRAANRGLSRCAWEESLHHVERGLALCAEVAEPKERLRLELGLLITKGTVHFSTRGYGAPEVAEAFGRAQELCEDLDEELPLEVLNGLWAFHVVRGDLAATEALLPRLRLLAQREGDPVCVLQGRASLGLWCFLRGDFVAARDHLAAAIEKYPTPEFQRFRREYGYDGGFYAYSYGMASLYVLGELDKSRAVCDEMIAIADGETDPYTRAMIWGFRVSAAHDLGEVDVALELSDRIATLASEQQLPVAMAAAATGRGWALSRRGEFDAGIAQIQLGLDLFQMAGIADSHSFYLTYLAEAYRDAGRVDEGLAAVDEGLAHCETRLARFHESTLVRHRGELLLLRGDTEEGEAHLRRSLDIARRQRARSLELRAAMSLALRLRDRGATGEARSVLAEVYDGFTEGLDTPLLQEAKALLP